jgi:hypothetical protein
MNYQSVPLDFSIDVYIYNQTIWSYCLDQFLEAALIDGKSICLIAGMAA